MPPPLVQSGKFSDCEAWSEAVAGWNLRFQQLDGGPLAAKIDRVELPGIILQRVALSRRFHQSGCAPDGVLSFGVPGDAPKLACSGRPFTSSDVVNFSRSNGFDHVSERGFSGQTFSVLTDSFLEDCLAIGGTVGIEDLAYGEDRFSLPPAQVMQVKFLASSVMQFLQSGKRPVCAVQELVADIRYLLAVAVTRSRSDTPNLPRVAREHAVDKALEAIHASDGLITVPEVCKYATTSTRSLSRGFKERFGITTKQYMVATRLSAVHSVLIGGKTNVTETAYDYGFWHLGRFASDYRSMFGEMPSETLRRNQAAVSGAM